LKKIDENTRNGSRAAAQRSFGSKNTGRSNECRGLGAMIGISRSGG
jgi:hypothetical protein